MATVREGSKQALLIVDVQVGVMQSVWDADRVIKNVANAVQKARQQGVPVIWVQHSHDEEIPYGSTAWAWVPELSPAEEETRVDKRFNSSFEQTNLEEILAELGVAHIVLAGAASNWCIRATAYGALDRGYDLTLIKDAHSTESIEFDDGVIVAAAHIVRELNIAMTWTDYPGRTTGTVAVEALEFAASAAPI
ncbi:MAG: isochorismatase family protein [Caldilineaceae bacterium]|nr:isochorismatase family protein [Caldilineaceae bacterium]